MFESLNLFNRELSLREISFSIVEIGQTLSESKNSGLIVKIVLFENGVQGKNQHKVDEKIKKYIK